MLPSLFESSRKTIEIKEGCRKFLKKVCTPGMFNVCNVQDTHQKFMWASLLQFLLFLTQFLYDYRQMNLFGFSIEERVIGIPSQKIAKATENKRERESSILRQKETWIEYVMMKRVWNIIIYINMIYLNNYILHLMNPILLNHES